MFKGYEIVIFADGKYGLESEYVNWTDITDSSTSFIDKNVIFKSNLLSEVFAYLQLTELGFDMSAIGKSHGTRKELNELGIQK